LNVLFVCSGNLCRSPMAAAYLRALAARRGLHELVVDSAGTLGIEGEPATLEAIQALAEIGVDLTAHRSRGLRAADLERADYVLAMTQEHLREMAAYAGAGRGQRLLLRTFEHGRGLHAPAPDLEDPMGASLGFYRRQRDLIVTCVDQLLRHLEDAR
jgi:protein-tyrosine phosphatase